ncbi:F0F1 ATP synthase subunit B [Candidatus Uhrbacteria bacterium]|nr:F0F1 ATP synthase subunit B [Candidatus Uhrbacteria bacterium]
MSTEIAAEATGGVLGTLGINGKLFLAQLFNFAIVMLVVWRWVWRPVMRLLEERSKKIEKSLAQAAAIEKEMAGLETKRQAMLVETEKKAEAVLKETEAIAEARRQEALVKSRQEVEKILREGVRALETEKKQMVARAKTEVADLVIAATEKVLAETLSEKREQALVERALKEI